MAPARAGLGFVRELADPAVADATRFGGKASGLSRMAAAGVPVPPAFVIGAEGFHYFRSHGEKLSGELMAEVVRALRRLEAASGKTFGGVERPLLVSVRSGAAVSMPGMMDTVLNLGLTARSAFALARARGAPDFALDTWLRFWRMYFDTVLDLDSAELTDAARLAEIRAREEFSEAAFEGLEQAILGHMAAVGEPALGDPLEQLERAIAAVFRSWDSARAKAYRRHHDISDDLGTAVTVQAMVFGNADENSGSGVAFTRNPNDGARALYGEYLIGRQGEDLVAGTHTPIDLSDPNGMDIGLRGALIKVGDILERLYRDAVDLEFTIESGKLYLLQVRPAKRTAAAAIQIAGDLAAEGLLTPREAILRIKVEHIRKLSRPAFDEDALAAARLIAQGLGSSPGHAHGAVMLDSDRAADAVAAGREVILLRPTTSPKDIRGMLSANGVVTATGGALSHAAVVSRALDKPCIVGCEVIGINLDRRTFTIGGETWREGDEISVDGAAGKVFAGALALRPGGANRSALRRILKIADAESSASVWVAPRNALELHELAQDDLPGVGVARLTDLVIAGGAIEDFVERIALMGGGAAQARAAVEISEIVREACRPLFAELAGRPLHVRLSRISSDRARRLIENWTEMPPDLFLPLGSPAYLRAVLSGLAAAAKAVGGLSVTALIGGIVDFRELDRFRDIVSEFDGLSAGAMIQNGAALHASKAMAERRDALWIDPVETIRTAYGFPTEILHSEKTLDDYAAKGFLAANPFARPAAFLETLFASAAPRGDGNEGSVGVDLSSGFWTELAVGLHEIGFRRFAASPGRRDELRLILARRREE